jgi:hypothetical protein
MVAMVEANVSSMAVNAQLFTYAPGGDTANTFQPWSLPRSGFAAAAVEQSLVLWGGITLQATHRTATCVTQACCPMHNASRSCPELAHYDHRDGVILDL